jgi:hypothetical protein
VPHALFTRLTLPARKPLTRYLFYHLVVIHGVVADMRVANILATVAALKGVAMASTFTPTKPPSVPLAVRSPYLNVWLDGDSGCILPGSWPRFWT